MSGPGLNVPVDTAPGADMWVIWAPVSDDPTPSTTIRPGLASISRCLVVGVSSAPPLATTASDDTSAVAALDGGRERSGHRVADHGRRP